MKHYPAAIILTCLICLASLCMTGCQKESESAQPRAAQIDLDAVIENIEIADGFKPSVGIVLGSGLSGLADEVDVVDRISYSDIPGFPQSTVAGHKGEYIFGYLEGIPVVLMNGRIHYYEGYSMEEVVTPARIMALLGADTVILTCAAGSLNPDIPPGSLVCINDQITSFIPSPLIGQNDESLGERFVDMSEPYDRELQKLLHKAAKKEGIDLKDGIFLQVTGPQYETKAESEMYASLGADTVSMSTGCETLALRHMGVRVLGINCVTNYCPNCSDENFTHDDVQSMADKAGNDMIRLVRGVLKQMGN